MAIKFIQIKDGLSIRKEDIESVERQNDGGTRITTRYNTHTTSFPYSTILTLLETENLEERVKDIPIKNPINNPLYNPLSNQFFAG